jgi:hypothetical protein
MQAERVVDQIEVRVVVRDDPADIGRNRGPQTGEVTLGEDGIGDYVVT